MSQRELLIISFSYAPMVNARAFRWTALAEEWARRGIPVSVVCSWYPGQPIRETRNGVEIYRAGFGPIERLRARFASSRQEAIRTVGRQESAGSEKATRTILNRMRSFLAEQVWHKVYWPDTSCLWYLPAVKTAKSLLNRAPGTTVVTVSPTFTAVVVGYTLLGRARPAKRWVIDLGDPFCFADRAPPNNFRFYRRLNYRFERRAFALADAVAVTNPATQREYRRLFPESTNKIYVIPPLISGDREPATPDKAEQTTSSNLRIVYLGTLYRSIRRPDFLLALFHALQVLGPQPQVELHFFGDIHQCGDSFKPYEHHIGTSLFLHGVVSRVEAERAIRDAAVLVNIGNDTSYQLPSKLVEYAVSGKPILNISTVADDSSEQFLRTYPARVCLIDRGCAPTPHDIEAFSRFVLQAEYSTEPAASQDWLAPFRMESIASQYERLLFAENRERS